MAASPSWRYADTELFYGRQNIELLQQEAEHQLAKDLDDEPHHRTARIAEWLRGELEASYHFLEQAATPRRSAELASSVDPLEELGDRIARRDFARIAQMQVSRQERPAGQAGPADRTSWRRTSSAERRKRVVNMLSFALQIQAAGVNRRLKQDMIDQDPTLKPEYLRNVSFFEPEVSDEAFHAFEQYVKLKWPLRVYAIEPVIAQQNVADAFGRQQAVGVRPGRSGADRTLARRSPASRPTAAPPMMKRPSASTRRWSASGPARAPSAGSSTPGFRPAAGSNGRLLTDIALLLNGRVADPIGNDQSIEPGQRECTALVEMPNFVPKIEFVTVANWFRTSEVGDGQKSDLEKASILGRKLVAAENALNQAKVEGQYRPDEYQIAMDRIKQLKDLMPTQRLVVRVPFSGDHNDSRIFCSQGLQLRPSLLGWHGRPPEKGEESTIFVEGRNFSVHDTHVIAGGKPAKSVLVSRNLLQVTIAKDALPTPSAQGDPLLDINVATPNGVSNHLLIKMAKPHPDEKPPHDDETTAPAGTATPPRISGQAKSQEFDQPRRGKWRPHLFSYRTYIFPPLQRGGQGG